GWRSSKRSASRAGTSLPEPLGGGSGSTLTSHFVLASGCHIDPRRTCCRYGCPRTAARFSTACGDDKLEDPTADTTTGVSQPWLKRTGKKSGSLFASVKYAEG